MGAPSAREDYSTFGRLLDDPVFQGKILEAIYAGKSKDISFSVHNYTHPFLREWGDAGEIKIFYEPEQPKELGVVSDNLIYVRDPESTRGRAKECPTKGELDYYRTKWGQVERYLIPPNRVGSVFDMIEDKRLPSEIVAYIMGETATS